MFNYLEKNGNRDYASQEDLNSFTGLEDLYNKEYSYEICIEIPTGSNNKFKLKNIYDLAGNMWEWTTEVGDHSSLYEPYDMLAVFRGGAFDGTGETWPLNTRGGNRSASGHMAWNLGFRVVLYIQ